jgi:hypothetical protein
VTRMTNPYCETLGIDVPALERVRDHPEANTYALLIVALLERGGATTLAEVAERFAAAGLGPAASARLSLTRCRPARAPVYRDGDLYALDPHADELDLWLFRLGLRPPRVPRLAVARPLPAPLPGPDEPVSVSELEEAWRDAGLSAWSAQRLALAVLDAHGEAMTPEDVVAFVTARTRWHRLTSDSGALWRRDSAVRVREDGRWEIGPDRGALGSARRAVRERVETVRRWAAMRPDPAVWEATGRAVERQRAAHAAELAALRRVLVHAFPSKAPEAVALVDVGTRAVETFLAPELDVARARILAYDVIGAVDVRGVLRALAVDPGPRRLAELGAPRKSKRLNRRGRTLRITPAMLVQGSCGIARPFGDGPTLEAYLREGHITRLRGRLEADAKSLFALYQYGRLHGAVRLRWGFLDEMIPVPWVHRDEGLLHDLKRQALERAEVLEVVAGNAPGWAAPWARARRCRVERDGAGYGLWLVDEAGLGVDDRQVQLARLAPTR